MAVVKASHSFDITGIDLHPLVDSREDWDFLNNAGLIHRGITYRDGFLAEWRDGSTDLATMFRGDKLNANASGRLTAGVVESFSEMLWTGTRYVELWGISGVSIRAASLDSAMRSEARADDDRLLIAAFDGNDRFVLSPDADIANGFGGDDRVNGRGGGDVLAGGDGNDRLRGQAGNDRFFLDRGDDVISGGPGRDLLVVNSGADVSIRLGARRPQDTGLGDDRIRGVEDAWGGRGDDRLLGSKGQNELSGNNGRDVLDGRGGNDLLLGGRGADLLTGGPGQDSLTGGAGADSFVFRSLRDLGFSAGTADVITDFRPGADRIDLSAIDASLVTGGNNAFLWRGDAAFGTSAQGELRVVRDDRPGRGSDSTLILIDTDGDAAAEAQLRLRGLHDLGADDFLL
ncbi:calcium-binding protein [Paracoccus spongiarum]|uniref:Calcium-binding protein n=1 Tax=Paracoccus spongiarum TaxID=3064387 RepID=A0ABT9JFZ4_9RHOB|nr:calcium-binding protein [Paracoccus sp. 2205BS29-5]MDP5308754.1 calcium-binding protein [Paracoccus sp. 2205BS29-5]